MHIHVVEPGQGELTPDTAVVIPIFEDGDRGYGTAAGEVERKTLERFAAKGRITGEKEEVYFLPQSGENYGGAATIGLGKRADFEAETMRRAAGKLVEMLQRERINRIVFDGTAGEAYPVEAFIEGIMLGQYEFNRYKQKQDRPKPLVEEIVFVEADADGIDDVRAGCGRAVLGCMNVNWARDLANTPPDVMTPNHLATAAERMSEETGCTCTILDEDSMEDLGMNGILAVGRGSAEPSKLIIVEYKGEGAEETFALVGKGVTFDTGGISLKGREDMHEMKYDMCGAAAVLGAMKTIAQAKPHVNAVCVVPAAENRPGPEAYLPSDIIRMYNGKTVEVHNTDAEGRMLLADALAYVEKEYKPGVIVDAATLTGACVVALGHYAAAVFSNHDDLVADLERAALATGDRIWPLPLWEDYAKLIEGTHADLCNIGPKGEAGSVVAACFLENFISDTPWAHLDIAGTAWGMQNISYLNPDHASGYGVRLLSQWVLDAAAKAGKFRE